jgi:hypothetical protein
MHKLALLGGEPVRRHLFPGHNTIGPEEKQAAIEVLDSGNLSQFLGSWSDDFYGGPKVQEFERVWAAHAQTKFGYSVNSNTRSSQRSERDGLRYLSAGMISLQIRLGTNMDLLRFFLGIPFSLLRSLCLGEDNRSLLTKGTAAGRW